MQAAVDVKALGHVAVLMGGFSSEREVSLSSGEGVLKALLSKGVNAEGFDPARRSITELAAGGFDRVFIALHGRFGEDGTVQGVLEYLGIPYTGPGVKASAVAMDKSATRLVWDDAGLPLARGMTVTSADQAQAVFERLGGSVVVKPDCEGSSIGVTKLKDATVDAIRDALQKALKLDREVLVEERIFGRELTVGILGGKALPVIEIKAPAGDYDYQNKYFGNAVKYDCPAGWGRIDLMMRPDGSFVLLELNTSPGMTPHSLVPMAARAVGLSYEDLVVKVLASATLDHVRPKVQ